MQAKKTSVNRRGALGLIGAASTATLFTPPTIVMAAAPREKITVAVGAEHALVYLFWDLAKGLGYFEQEGLDANLIYTKGGSEASQALVSGSADYSGNAIDHAIAAASQGKSLVMISDFMGVPGITLLIRAADKAKYKTYADLKGKTVGITSPGSATHVLAIWMAKVAGMSKDDIKVIGVGGGSTMVAALQGGRVEAAFGNDPFVTQMMKAGTAVPLVDLFVPAQSRRAIGFHSYCFTGALTRADVIAKRPETTQKVANALVRAQKYLATHSSLQTANALSDELRGGVAEATWAQSLSHSRSAYTNHGEISLEGVAAVIETNKYFGDTGGGGNIDANKLFDNSFVEKANKAVKV